MENYPDSSEAFNTAVSPADKKKTGKNNKKSDPEANDSRSSTEEHTGTASAENAEETKNQSLSEQLTAHIGEKELPKEASEKEAPLEHLAPEEKRLASSEIVKARQEELSTTETTNTLENPAEVAALEASQLYMNTLYDKLNKFQPKELTAEEAIDIAAHETEQELLGGATAEDESVTEISSIESSDDNPDSHEFSLPFDSQESAAATETEPIANRNEVTTAPAAGGPGGNIPFDGSGGWGGGGGANLPPAGAGFSPNAPNPNIPVIDPNTLLATPNVIVQSNSSREGGMFVVGAVLGYFIGRRRGRIKTEARLLPIQKKLENEVQTLEARIAAKETRIRNLAYMKADQEKQARLQAKRSSREQSSNHLDKELPVPANREQSTDSLEVEQPRQPEAEVIPETLATTAIVEKIKTMHSHETMPMSEKASPRVEQLNSQNILEVSKDILINNERLSDIYRRGDIDERKLKFLVAEHLAGRDIQLLVKQETAAKELAGTPELLAAKDRTSADQITAVQLGGEQAVAEDAAKEDLSTRPLYAPSPAELNPYLQQKQNRSRQTAVAVGVIAAILLISIAIFL